MGFKHPRTAKKSHQALKPPLCWWLSSSAGRGWKCPKPPGALGSNGLCPPAPVISLHCACEAQLLIGVGWEDCQGAWPGLHLPSGVQNTLPYKTGPTDAHWWQQVAFLGEGCLLGSLGRDLASPLLSSTRWYHVPDPSQGKRHKKATFFYCWICYTSNETN